MKRPSLTPYAETLLQSGALVVLVLMLMCALSGCASPYIVRPGVYNKYNVRVFVYETAGEVVDACRRAFGERSLPASGCVEHNRRVMHVQMPSNTDEEAYYFCIIGHEFAHLLENSAQVWHGLRLWDPCYSHYLNPDDMARARELGLIKSQPPAQ